MAVSVHRSIRPFIHSFIRSFKHPLVHKFLSEDGLHIMIFVIFPFKRNTLCSIYIFFLPSSIHDVPTTLLQQYFQLQPIFFFFHPKRLLLNNTTRFFRRRTTNCFRIHNKIRTIITKLFPILIDHNKT